MADRPPPDPMHRRPATSAARALGSPTRAGIYASLRAAGRPLTVRDVAATHSLHPNVARTHLEILADAGLVGVGQRRSPQGGRPAKLYSAPQEATRDPVARELAAAETKTASPTVALLVRLLVALLEHGDERRDAAASRVAMREGRRVMAGAAASQGTGSSGLASAAQTVATGLAAYAPALRVVRAGAEWVDLVGVRGMLEVTGEVPASLAERLERGLLAGAFAALGCHVTVADAGATAGGAVVWRVRSGPTVSSRTSIPPVVTVDARGQQRETGVVRAMRAVTGLRGGEVLEVLAEGPGSPAAFARWADRAGHELLGVERAVDDRGRPAVRLLIRKGS